MPTMHTLDDYSDLVKSYIDAKDSTKADASSLATVATSGKYSDLTGKPSIPTVNNATLTIQKNGTAVKTFTANASSDVTCNITVPTKVSELTNDSGYTSNTGTVTKVSTGVGLTGGDVTTTGTVKAKLRSETALTVNSAAATTTSGRVYPVAPDKTGYLAVNVPWTDTTKGNGISTNAAKTGSGTTVTSTIAANTTMDNAIGTLLNNDVAENTSIQNLSNQVKYNTENGVKNILPITLKSKTVNKIAITVNVDGTITVNSVGGEASSRLVAETIGTFTGVTDIKLSGCPSGGNSNTYCLQLKQGSSYPVTETGSGVTYTCDPSKTYEVVLVIRSGQTLSNKVFKPMVTLGFVPNSDYAHFQPYAEPNSVLTQKTTGLIDNTKANGCVNSLGITKAELHSLNTLGSWSGETYTESGATFACEYDDAGYLKKVTVNKSSGTESNSSLYLKLKPEFPYLPIKLIGCPSGGGTNWDDRKYYLYYANWSNTTGLVADYGNGGIINSQFSYSSYPSARLAIQIKSGQTANNLVFYPMLIPPTMQGISNVNPVPYAKSNKELTEDVAGLESQINADTGLIRNIVQVDYVVMNMYCTNDTQPDISNLTTASATDIAQALYDVFKKLGGKSGIRYTGVMRVNYLKASDGSQLGSSVQMFDLYSNVAYSGMLNNNTTARLTLVETPYGNTIQSRFALWGQTLFVYRHGMSANTTVYSDDVYKAHSTISTYKG